MTSAQIYIPDLEFARKYTPYFYDFKAITRKKFGNKGLFVPGFRAKAPDLQCKAGHYLANR